MTLTLEPIVRAGDLFDSLGKEEDQEDDMHFDRQRSRLEELIEIFESSCREVGGILYDRFIIHNEPTQVDLKLYETFMKNIMDDVSSKDVDKFCRFYLAQELDNYENDLPMLDIVSGFYLSALINKSAETDHIVNIDADGRISYLGYKNNGKNITANCRIGSNTGWEMESGSMDITDLSSNAFGRSVERLRGGKVIIRNALIKYDDNGNIWMYQGGGSDWYIGGNSGGEIDVISHAWRVGENMSGGIIKIGGSVTLDCGKSMKGGEIYVNGSVFGHVGNKLKGGKIYVEGDTEKLPGMEMKGGEIHIGGDYPRLPKSSRGGNIYHKGKLVLRDGKIL